MPQVDELVSVLEYQLDWPVQFATERQRISEALGDSADDLEHIGSTAVPGLVAKPTIDIMLGIDSWPPSLELKLGIEGLGYESLGEAGIPGRQYFRLRSPTRANLHVVLKAGTHWVNNLALRDLLRRSRSARERYAQAKFLALANGTTSLLAYSAAKATAVSELLTEALKSRES